MRRLANSDTLQTDKDGLSPQSGCVSPHDAGGNEQEGADSKRYLNRPSPVTM
jgi:hypothetical protein